MTNSPDQLTGRCLCGAVTFITRPPYRLIIACHCRDIHDSISAKLAAVIAVCNAGD